MEDISFYNEKMNNLISLIIKLGKSDRLDKYKVVKTMYFADKKHLEMYGRFITEDKYVKMQHGPVPSKFYDRINHSKLFPSAGNNEIYSKHILDLDYISESEIECIQEAFGEVMPLNFTQIRDMTHDEMYHKKNMNEVFTIEDFITSLELEDSMIEYIKLGIENKSELVAHENW